MARRQCHAGNGYHRSTKKGHPLQSIPTDEPLMAVSIPISLVETKYH